MSQSPPMFSTVRPLILASASPRRRQLLAELGLAFTTAIPQVDEIARIAEGPEAFARRLAGEKAAAVACCHPGAWVLAADTVVVAAGLILGKPRDHEDARATLRLLSGNWHEVWTGYCLKNSEAGVEERGAVVTGVLFSPLTEALIAAYIATDEPLDKAGAYGIQGRGGLFVQELRGSYSNVVGLPLAEVGKLLLDRGVITPNQI